MSSGLLANHPPLDDHGTGQDVQAQQGTAHNTGKVPFSTLSKKEMVIFGLFMVAWLVFSIVTGVTEYSQWRDYQEHPVKTFYTNSFPDDKFPDLSLLIFPLIDPSIANLPCGEGGCCYGGHDGQKHSRIVSHFNDGMASPGSNGRRMRTKVTDLDKPISYETGRGLAQFSNESFDFKKYVQRDASVRSSASAKDNEAHYFTGTRNFVIYKYDGLVGPFVLGGAKFGFQFDFGEMSLENKRPKAANFDDLTYCIDQVTNQEIDCPSSAQIGFNEIILNLTCQVDQGMKTPPIYIAPVSTEDIDDAFMQRLSHQWNVSLTLDPTEFISTAVPGGVYISNNDAYAQSLLKFSAVRYTYLQSSGKRNKTVISATTALMPPTLGINYPSTDDHSIVVTADGSMQVNAETSPITWFSALTGWGTRMHMAFAAVLVFFSSSPRVPYHFCFGQDASKYRAILYEQEQKMTAGQP